VEPAGKRSVVWPLAGPSVRNFNNERDCNRRQGGNILIMNKQEGVSGAGRAKMETVRQRIREPFMWLTLAATMVFIQFGSVAADQSLAHTIFGELLATHVQEGVVNYAGFKAQEKKLDQYLSVLENTNPDSLNRDEQFAFYINAYNAWTIKLILSGYPGVKSIKDLGSIFQSPWKKEIITIHGEKLSLDDIEHNILRPRFKDPRVHFAVNCASKGCPPLISEPYRGAVLEDQLNSVTRNFINAPGRYRLEGDTLWINSIFKWFPEDFNNDAAGFFRNYAEGELKQLLEERQGQLKVKYLDYDWSLNGV
jgi:hypothetical protein